MVRQSSLHAVHFCFNDALFRTVKKGQMLDELCFHQGRLLARIPATYGNGSLEFATRPPLSQALTASSCVIPVEPLAADLLVKAYARPARVRRPNALSATHVAERHRRAGEAPFCDHCHANPACQSVIA